MEELTKVTPEDINLLRERLGGGKSIIIVGAGHVGKTVLYHALNERFIDNPILGNPQPAVFVDNEEWIDKYLSMHDGRFEVNGVWYRPVKEIERRYMGRAIEAAIATAMFYKALDDRNSHKATPGQCDCDIVEEFKLIQLKKSKLSSAQRKLVVSQFNQQYVKV